MSANSHIFNICVQAKHQICRCTSCAKLSKLRFISLSYLKLFWALVSHIFQQEIGLFFPAREKTTQEGDEEYWACACSDAHRFRVGLVWFVTLTRMSSKSVPWSTLRNSASHELMSSVRFSLFSSSSGGGGSSLWYVHHCITCRYGIIRDQIRKCVNCGCRITLLPAAEW